MSSAGHIMDSINRMKANRALRNKRGSFNLKEANTFPDKPTSKYTKYSFKEASPEYLKNLKTKLSSERKRDVIKHLIILIISLGIFSLFLI